MAKVITGENFKTDVMESDVPVLLDFWAPWCGPCRAIGPVIDQLAVEFEGKALVGKVNVDEEGFLAEQFKVVSIPTLVVMKNGQTVEKVVGGRSASELADLINRYL